MINRLYCTAALKLLVACFVLVGYSQNASAEGDAEQGEKLAYTCLGCHGVDSYRNPYPSYRVPKLGGQHESYIAIALKAYRSGERSHGTMQANAGSLSDQDIADIAAFFASYGEAKEAGVVTSGVAEGKEKSTTCVACHGEKGISANAIWPNLAGQHEDYLANSLKQYKLANADETGGYSVRKNAVMAGLAAALSDEDIDALAKYFAAQEGLFTTKHK
ncbi:MAG: c-type cytochrome [Pseudomonadota bacterium]